MRRTARAAITILRTRLGSHAGVLAPGGSGRPVRAPSAALCGALTATLVVCAASAAKPLRHGFPARIVARDPGARVDGDTIVGTADGGVLFGVPDRPNYIVALGSNETIVGGARNDELGALGDNATIDAGRGSDFILGARGSRIVGGAGRAMILVPKDDATVQVKSSGNEIVMSGRRDRVSCARGSRHDVIYSGAGDSIGATCRADHARVLPLARLRRAPLQVASPHAVQGDGSNGNPYVAPCDDPAQNVCTVSSFPGRSLTGFWANEYVPAYRCPDDHPYLLGQTFTPGSPGGVEVLHHPGVVNPDVAITGLSQTAISLTTDLVTGTLTGFPNSSVTNWSTGTGTYQIVLHCTSNPGAGYYVQPR